MTAARWTWRRAPRETGLRAVCAGPRAHHLCIGGVEVAAVSHSRNQGFYWYCGSSEALGLAWRNTAAEGRFWPTEAEAEAECKAFIVPRVKAVRP